MKKSTEWGDLVDERAGALFVCFHKYEDWGGKLSTVDKIWETTVGSWASFPFPWE